jgi:hypothetical protein
MFSNYVISSLLVANISGDLGGGGGSGMYGFFAFIRPVRLEKLSRWIGVR